MLQAEPYRFVIIDQKDFHDGQGSLHAMSLLSEWFFFGCKNGSYAALCVWGGVYSGVAARCIFTILHVPDTGKPVRGTNHARTDRYRSKESFQRCKIHRRIRDGLHDFVECQLVSGE